MKILNYLNHRILLIFLTCFLISKYIKLEKKATFVTLVLIFTIIFFNKYFFNNKEPVYLNVKNQKTKEYFIYILLFIVTIILQNNYLNFEQITWDVSSYLVASIDLKLGNLPFETQWESKGPLLIYIYRFLSLVVNDNYIYFKIINDFVLLVVALLLFKSLALKTKNNYFLPFISTIIFLLITSHQWFVSEFSEIYCLLALGIVYFLYSKNKINFFVIGFILSIVTLINQGALILILPYFLNTFFINFKLKKYSDTLKQLFGFIIPHIFFLLIYYFNNLFEVYKANYITIPLSYISGESRFFSQIIVSLRRIYEYDQFLYYSILIICFFTLIKIIKSLRLKSFNFLFRIEILNFLAGISFYVIASHSYAHHLFYIIFYLCFLTIFLEENQKKLLITSVITSFIFLFPSVANQSISNLKNINSLYENYPLRQLSYIIDNQFESEYSILALDYVLVLHYLEVPNFSYIVHPGNHYENYIVESLIKIGKVGINDFNHISYLIEQEPDVIICNPTDIILGKATNRDFYNCAIDDYKKNYIKLDTTKFITNPNLNLYRNPYESLNVYIKKND